MKRFPLALLFVITLSSISLRAQTPAFQVTDRFAPVSPSSVRLEGFLGERCLKNARARLATKNEAEMLAGFERRPGQQAWVGEHVGKWLHAATLAWSYTNDPELRTKLDRVARALIATQQADGYLGTYADGAHWAMGKEQGWDVWVHKYNLLGLITYATYTGDQPALDSARRIGELLLATFGRGAQLDLNERSTHVGMASGSVLEPTVLLARATGDPRYLDFAREVVARWEEAHGPRLLSALTAKSAVRETANAKAYEMLSCLVGLCELYRATGETRYLTPALNAWGDIVANHLLVTGSGSNDEHWQEARLRGSRSDSKVAETCVTVTWIQLNQQLLRLTGEARFADELEKTYYNHLAAAQRPDGTAWSYFTALDGTKPYQTEQNCCTSSGPRGWALLPTSVYMTNDDGIVVNFFAPGTANLRLRNGTTVLVRQETAYPLDGRVTLTVSVSSPAKFSLRVRVPRWSSLSHNGEQLKASPGSYWLLRQTWSRSQKITLDFALPTRIVGGTGADAGRVAVVRGPQVLALDARFNPLLRSLEAVALGSSTPQLNPSLSTRDADGQPLYETEGVVLRDLEGYRAGDRIVLRFSPYAAAGASGSTFTAWIAGIVARPGSKNEVTN
jgi:DUF1680 family protein